MNKPASWLLLSSPRWDPVLGVAGVFLGAMLLLIALVSGLVLYKFAYNQVTAITDDILRLADPVAETD